MFIKPKTNPKDRSAKRSYAEYGNGKSSCMAYRLIAAFVVLSLLPSLFFGSTDRQKAEKGQLRSAYRYLTLSESDMCRYPAAVLSEELFRDNAVRISHSHSLRRFGRPDFFRYCFGGNTLLLTAVCILFVLIAMKGGDENLSHRFIIKYIHDQDGHKL